MITENINGHPIIHSATFDPVHSDDLVCRVALVDRGLTLAHGRWVTCVQYAVEARSKEWQKGWLHGHYFCDRDEAETDYHSRMTRMIQTLKRAFRLTDEDELYWGKFETLERS